MERESFVFYRSFYEAISEIEDKALRMDCFDAIITYALYGIEPDASQTSAWVQMVFKLVKPQIDANNRKFENGKKGAEFGKLGGRPKKDKNPIGVIDKNPIGVLSETPNVNVNVNDNVNDNENIKKVAKATRFIKPTVEDIKEYCQERNNQIDPNGFYDFYESKGWKVGNQPMKDWKACVRTWERTSKTETKKISSFNQFPQRQYDFGKLEEELLDN